MEIDALCILFSPVKILLQHSRYIKNAISFCVTFIFLGFNHIISKFEINKFLKIYFSQIFNELNSFRIERIKAISYQI